MTTLTLPFVPTARTGDEGRPPASTGDGCPEYAEDICSVCEEPTTWVVIDPCPSGDCDRPICLPCADRHGYPIN